MLMCKNYWFSLPTQGCAFFIPLVHLDYWRASDVPEKDRTSARESLFYPLFHEPISMILFSGSATMEERMPQGSSRGA